MIGNIYNSLPNPENFKSNKTQSEYDFKGEWFRNTSNYHIGDDRGYNYVIDSSKEKHSLHKLNLSLLVRFQGLESSLVVMIIRLEIKLSSIIVRQLEVTPLQVSHSSKEKR